MRARRATNVTSGGTRTASTFSRMKLQVLRNAVIKMHEGERRLGRRSLGLPPLRYVQRVLDLDESADAPRWGSNSLIISICLDARSSAKFVSPVTLPPGLDRL